MNWMNSSQIDNHMLTRMSALSRQVLKTVFPLSTVVRRSFHSVDFEIPPDMHEVVPLSLYGEEMLGLFEDEDKLPSNEKCFVAFLIFYHRDLLIECDKIDTHRLLTVVNNLISSSSVVIPDRFGRSLYDRFNSQAWGERLEFLEPEQATNLLQGEQAGVYQLGRVVTGPLGIILSEEQRLVPLSSSIPLWHCSDPGCGRIHSVKLRKYGRKPITVLRRLESWLDSSEGPASEWQYPLETLLTNEGPKVFCDLLPLIADTISGNERTALTAKILTTSRGGNLRTIIEARLGANIARGSPNQVAEALTGNTQLQLIATLPDNVVIESIDNAVRDDVIKIPQSEIRRANMTALRASSGDTACSLSVLGIRSERENPSRFLSSLIYDAYNEQHALSDLNWRTDVDNASPATVFEFLHRRGPREAIKKLIAPSQRVAEHIARKVYTLAPLAVKETLDEDRLLWKLGFDVPRYDQKYSKFRSSLIAFRESAIRADVRLSDSDRDSIRSSGVNAFVYSENFIEELISYNVWLLSQDHFGYTLFKYSFDNAVSVVSDVVGKVQNGHGQEVVWSTTGGNTLGVLLAYARAAANWMRSLPDMNREVYERPVELLPHFTTPGDSLFPFVHTVLWADADKTELREFALRFEGVVKTLEQSKVAEIRNGIGHYRDKDGFPLTDAIVACETRLTSALDTSDVTRLLPKAFWMRQKIAGEFGISSCEMVDYADRKINVSAPQVMRGLINPRFGHAYLVPSCSLLGRNGSKLIFELNEESAYTRLWAAYPPRTSLANVRPLQLEIGIDEAKTSREQLQDG